MWLDYDVRKGKRPGHTNQKRWEVPGQMGSKAKASLQQPGAPASAESWLDVQTPGSVPNLLNRGLWQGLGTRGVRCSVKFKSH